MRFSLKCLFTFTTLFVVLLGVWATNAHSQGKAVAELKGLGHSVGYQQNPWVPDTLETSLCQAVGPDFIRRVAVVKFAQGGCDYDIVKPRLQHLQGLKLVMFFGMPNDLTAYEVKADFPEVDVVDTTQLFPRNKSTPFLVL